MSILASAWLVSLSAPCVCFSTRRSSSRIYCTPFCTRVKDMLLEQNNRKNKDMIYVPWWAQARFASPTWTCGYYRTSFEEVADSTRLPFSLHHQLPINVKKCKKLERGFLSNILTQLGMKLLGSSSVLCSTYSLPSSSPYLFIIILLDLLEFYLFPLVS